MTETHTPDRSQVKPVNLKKLADAIHIANTQLIKEMLIRSIMNLSTHTLDDMLEQTQKIRKYETVFYDLIQQLKNVEEEGT